MPPDIFDSWKPFGRNFPKGKYGSLNRPEKRQIRQNDLVGVVESFGFGTFVPVTLFDFSQEKETLDDLR